MDLGRALLALALVALAAQIAVYVWRKRARRLRILARVARAGEGERRARQWLERLGFEVLGAQVAAEYALKVDDAAVPIGVRADYVVARGGARYVVEVKTGSVAPKVETPATRRQLLEYKIAFEADGVLLVDAESGRVKEVTFPGVGVAPSPPVWPRLLLVAVASFALALLLRR